MATKKIQLIGSLCGGLVDIDSTLSQSGKAADAKATGDAINKMQVNIDEVASLVGDSSVADQIAGKADVGHNHNDVYYTEVEIDNKVAELNTSIAEKSDAEHMHTIEDITNLQPELDAKYEKPSTGIPVTDLSLDVQETLNNMVQNLDGYATEEYVSNVVNDHNTSTSAHNDIYYTKSEIDNLELITTDDIDAICGTTIQMASEVEF